ncbi:cytochrome P450, putative [Talaromyces stipitatus ATCC 10500]|uniref:Cytochrome P450, putative n=1 Tax=Talaromyces stipitatus (strain ATCC 10500 / CBS 375.48 / QM 6759 / NRRL 1006) TaxID=441959 RepID=B8M0F0_TALSN|nr:cytochrome P450, putative [Talaromyces stipitatus ATCC 10500]EED21247.1 cytochrome P450, putative [Talaromyces stipitatus ATCC 10500]
MLDLVMNLTTYIAIVGLVIGIYILTRPKSTSSFPLPPGPKPLPIIGNVHQAPKSHGWRTYREWSKQYGPIVHVNMLGQPVIILSTSEVVHDLLAKRGATFSDRPRLFLATELALKGLNILMMNYTEQFRQHQRLQVSVLNSTSTAAYLPFQTLESQQLMHDLLENAGGAGVDVQGIFQRTTASIIHMLLYGFRIKDSNDPVLRTVIELNDEFSDFIKVGAHIVDQFPILNNLPGFLAPWKTKAETHYKTKYDLRIENFRRGLESDDWTISKHLKKTVEKDGLDMPMDELAFELGTMIDAALDGTTDSLIWFVVACITQDQGFIAKAREQLYTVVGRNRLPTPDDKPNLPYITAIVEEIFRWRPAGPEGVPHLNREEATYNGYIIPKGSVIIPNVWTISREEALFGSDPDDFIPDRWLEEDGKTLKALPTAVFGYGRRTCPGRYFARNVIWIVVAQLLWSFDIKAGLSEETGESLPVDPIACTYGLVMRALPYKASFNPRGPWVREVIARDGDTYGTDHAIMLNEIGAEFA